MKSTLIVYAALLTLAVATAAQPQLIAAEPQPLRLWQGDAPGAVGNTDDDTPTITMYLPESDKPTAALVIFPGGGYGHLAIGHEGHEIAQWANSVSMAGIIVSYRHRKRGYAHPAPMLDAQRAIRTVRARAEEWNIDPTKVGVIGFSAGGHLATTVLTHFDSGKTDGDAIDQQSCRPDFGIVSYAVIAFDEPFTHRGSQRNLLGKDASPELVESLSNEKQVTKETPPCFVWHTAEDKVVPAENSLRFYSALTKVGSPSELHVFPRGRHGIGLAKDFPGANAWPNLARDWLVRRGMLNSPDTGNE
ncbi:MAG: alpha/beta hydrolase [Aureliella sp.]